MSHGGTDEGRRPVATTPFAPEAYEPLFLRRPSTNFCNSTVTW